MGIKSTVRLTRKEAIRRLVEHDLKAMEMLFQAKWAGLVNKQLEDALECENDKANDGEGFENYLITEEPN